MFYLCTTSQLRDILINKKAGDAYEIRTSRSEKIMEVQQVWQCN